MKKTVSLTEAIESGKKFRMSGHISTWWEVLPNGYVFCKVKSEYIRLSKTVVEAKYEVEEEELNITSSQFDEAMARVIENYPNNYTASKNAMLQIKQELGFLE